VHGNRQLLFGGMGRLTENSIVNYKNKSHAVTAELVVPDAGAKGVIIAVGGNIGGWSLYVKDGSRSIATTTSASSSTTSKARRRFRRARTRCGWSSRYDGGGLGKGGAVTLYVDGKPTGRARRKDREPGLLGRRDLRHRQ
jgi:arylsulfatase